MKKIVGILGMAAVLASGAFAADPATNFVVSEFKGEASLEWQANFADPDNIKMGMVNAASGNIKLGFMTAGDKGTTGDGVWGEIHIKSDAKDWGNTAAAAGNDWYGKADAKETLEARANTAYNKALTDYVNDPDLTAEENAAAKLEAAKKAYNAVYNAGLGGAGALNLPGVTVDVAKIHLVDGDFYAALDILKPSLQYGEFNTALAAPIYGKLNLVGKIGDNTYMKAGLALNLGMKDMFDFNVKFMDNSVAKTKRFGLALDASLKAIKNLDAKVMGTFNFDTEYVGFGATAGYKIALDMINEKTYVKPEVIFTSSKKKDVKADNTLVAGVMFGWGATGCNPDLDFIDDEDVAKSLDGTKKADFAKTSEGLSVTFGTDLKDKATNSLAVSLYDESLFSMLGIEDFGKLMTGAFYGTTFANDSYASRLAFAAKYHVDIDPVYFDLHGGMMTNLVKDVTDNEVFYKFGVGIGSKKIIDNTDVYAKYEFASSSKAKKPTTSGLTIGTKISF